MKFTTETAKAIRANYSKTILCVCGKERTGGNRTKYCSDACKQKAYRERKAKD